MDINPDVLEKAEVVLEQIVEGINAVTTGYVEEHQDKAPPSLALAMLLQHIVKTYVFEVHAQGKSVDDITNYLTDLIEYANDTHKDLSTLATIVPAQSE